MVVLHAALALLALWLIIAVRWPWWLRLLTTAALLLAVPAITVLHRIRRTRRIRSALAGIAVYTLYYAARVHAMAIAAIRAIRPREGPAASHPATISEEPVEIRAPAPDPQ